MRDFLSTSEESFFNCILKVKKMSLGDLSLAIPGVILLVLASVPNNFTSMAPGDVFESNFRYIQFFCQIWDGQRMEIVDVVT